MWLSQQRKYDSIGDLYQGGRSKLCDLYGDLPEMGAAPKASTLFRSFPYEPTPENPSHGWSSRKAHFEHPAGIVLDKAISKISGTKDYLKLSLTILKQAKQCENWCYSDALNTNHPGLPSSRWVVLLSLGRRVIFVIVIVIVLFFGILLFIVLLSWISSWFGEDKLVPPDDSQVALELR